MKRHHRALEGSETGGSEPQVFGDEGGRLWMVKAPNNPQNGQVLASEAVAAVLLKRLGGATPSTAVCELSPDVVAGLAFKNGVAWNSGDGFGSELMPTNSPIYAKGTHDPVANCANLCAVVVVDTLLGAHDGRQARTTEQTLAGWTVLAVDFGHDIGPGSWNRSTLTASAAPTELTDPNDWLSGASGEELTHLADSLDSISDADFGAIVSAIPLAWGPSTDDRSALVDYLVRRREPVVTLIRQRVKDKEAA